MKKFSKICCVFALLFICFSSFLLVGCNKKHDPYTLTYESVQIFSPDNQLVEEGFESQEDAIQRIKSIYHENYLNWKFVYNPDNNTFKVYKGNDLADLTPEIYYVIENTIYYQYIDSYGSLKYNRFGYLSGRGSNGEEYFLRIIFTITTTDYYKLGYTFSSTNKNN